jgi:starch synthase
VLFRSFAKKALNKRYLQKLCDLSVDADAFVMGMVGRLTEQKGFSIILAMLERFLNTHDKAQFVLLGTGDETIKARLQTLESKFPKRMKLFLTFDGTLPNYIYAGADVFVMPSRVEPCGLAQLIAMRYGTVPIVRQTGGLNDTVINYDPISRRGTGFSFFNYDAPSLAATCDEAYTLFTEDKPTFEALALRAMKEDFGLLKQANRMIDLYYLTRSEV